MKTKTLFTICLFLIACTGYAQKGNRIRVMSYNIRIGIGMDDSLRLNRAAKVIRNIKPDFVGLQEVDSMCERSGWVDQARELASLTKMHSIFAPAIERSKGLYGIAALVKKKPLNYTYIALPGIDEPRTFLILEYKNYLLCNTHLSLRAESRQESIKIIRNVLKAYRKPIILTGDFNMVPESDEFKMITKDWSLLSDSSIRTYPSNNPNLTLDYIFGFKAYSYQVLKKEVPNGQMASDHLPIYVDVKF